MAYQPRRRELYTVAQITQTMDKTPLYIESTQKKVIKFTMFIATILIIVSIFPKEAKFPYEFQKGTPWLHSSLFAPYSFAINKVHSELTHERDSLVKNFRPYFHIEEQTVYTQINLFQIQFDSVWTVCFKGVENNNKLHDEFFKFVKTQFEFIYSKGIIENTDVFDSKKPEEIRFFILNNKSADEFSISEVFTGKTAYEYCNAELAKKLEQKEVLASRLVGTTHNFIQELVISNYLLPNIIYDSKTTAKMKDNLMNTISLSSGMVQKGEGIINKGEVVSEAKYRILTSFKEEFEQRIGSVSNRYLIVLGRLILITLLLSILYLFLYNFRKDILFDNQKTLFILFLLVLMVTTSSIIMRFSIINSYVIPFAILPVIIRTFYDSRLALFVHWITILLVGFLVPNAFEFILLQFAAGAISIFSLRKLIRREQVFSAAVTITSTYCVVYFAISILQEGDISKIYWKNFLWFVGNGLLLLSTYPLIYFFEKMFNFLSDVSLMELADTNQPMLRLLAEKAPGTFQHSMQVANLAEEAVFQIGGNSLLARTGALYHDIGKTQMPHYFIENQAGENNPHGELDFDKSAEIIINHVYVGIELAKKYRLPLPIVDFIRTHHGTTKALYFYRSFLQKYPNKEFDRSKFTYPGPTPFTRETAIVMMADSVEAASRSLKSFTDHTISELVENIVNFQIAEDQFINTNITFKDISLIKDIFKKKLSNMYHARVEYPKENK